MSAYRYLTGEEDEFGSIHLENFLDKVEKALTLLAEGQKEVSDLAGMEQGSVHLATSTLEPSSNIALGDLFPNVFPFFIKRLDIG